MKKTIAPSELILNPDGSVYHLNLHPEQVAQTVIFVGDPDRVPRVTKYFDKIEFKVQKREFVIHTGWLGKKRITVISTGIGTDNIDIVMNELDALVNVDFDTRTVKDELTSLDIIRIGTSGILSKNLEVDDLLISAYAIGLEALLPYYHYKNNKDEAALSESFGAFAEQHQFPLKPSAVMGSHSLMEEIGVGMHRGITLTCSGFYAPQGRCIRLSSRVAPSFFTAASEFQFNGYSLTNFEMETSGIYGMSRLLGHRAVSCNALLAHRIKNIYSEKQYETVERLIRMVLERLEG